MKLHEFCENIKDECDDICKRKGFYFYKGLSILFWFLIFFIIVDPIVNLFLKEIEVLAQNYFNNGLVVLSIALIAKTTNSFLPENMTMLISGEFIGEIKEKKEMRKLAFLTHIIYNTRKNNQKNEKEELKIDNYLFVR